MTKRERLEDMGVALEKMSVLLEDDFWDEFQSKHDIVKFKELYRNEEYHYVLHTKIRFIKENLQDIRSILQGDLYEPMDRCF